MCDDLARATEAQDGKKTLFRFIYFPDSFVAVALVRKFPSVTVFLCLEGSTTLYVESYFFQFNFEHISVIFERSCHPQYDL